MTELVIRIQLPEGATVDVYTSGPTTPPPVQQPTPVATGPTLEDVKTALLAAVKINEAGALAALGVAKCSDVPAEKRAEVIQTLSKVEAPK